ncbi:MAG: hypothetical protein RL479_1635 [Verrucomicrobiota bacterium]
MSKPFHEPPIQRGHPIYRMMLPWVGSAVTRYHRITGTEGIEKIPEPGVPVILVCNHQNGLMDPLIHCGLMRQHQVHWLTRSDIFYHPVARFLMFSFNQMPIFRQRDRLPDIDARNRRIFEICVERLRCGAVIGLFPEGNHHGSKSIRPMKRGFVDLLDLGLKTDPTLARLQLLPVGLDYEQYDGFRRRLRYRVGENGTDAVLTRRVPVLIGAVITGSAFHNLCFAIPVLLLKRMHHLYYDEGWHPRNWHRGSRACC